MANGQKLMISSIGWPAAFSPRSHPGVADGGVLGAVNVAVLLGVVLDDLHQVGIPESGVLHAVGIETPGSLPAAPGAAP